MSERARLVGSAPVLLVRDVVKSANYYRDALGFTYDRFWGDPPAFVILSRDGMHLMLDQAPAGHVIVPNWQVDENIWNVYFWVTDADALLAEFRQRGARIDYDIHDKPYKIREFGIQDLDGYDVAFGHPIG
ncbi:bleomycin resistance protein [Opitutaceae bacterium EW11]|nr:bleomycin resistance protein [Opitutaceae bacterium EW11]